MKKAIACSSFVLGLLIITFCKNIVAPGMETLFGIETLLNKSHVQYLHGGGYRYESDDLRVWIFAVALFGGLVSYLSLRYFFFFTARDRAILKDKFDYPDPPSLGRCAFGFGFIFLIGMIYITNLIGNGGTSSHKYMYLIYNLRSIDGAKEQWAIDHHGAKGTLLTEADIFGNRYASSIKPQFGEKYNINPIGTPPEAVMTRSFQGLPKGTILRSDSDPESPLHTILPK